MTDWDDLIAEGDVRAATLDVPLCLDRTLVRAVNDATLALAEASRADKATGGASARATREAQDRLDEALAALEAAQTIITVSSIPANEWNELRVKHPPTADQRREGHVAHPEKFPIAAVARSIVKVVHRGKTVEGNPPQSWVRDTLRPSVTEGEWEALTTTVANLNSGSIDVGKLVGGIGRLRSSGPSSTTPPPTESPTPSSPEDGSGPTP